MTIRLPALGRPVAERKDGGPRNPAAALGGAMEELRASPERAPTMDANGVAVWDAETMRAALAVLDPPERMRLLDALDGRASRTETFVEYIDRVRPGYSWHEYNRRLARVLQDVVDGLRTRVLVFMPPQLGKSELVSRLLPAYYLYRYPHRTVALASYGAELAHELAGDARALYMMGGGALAAGSRKVRYWRTPEGGGMWASGVGGSATGRGFDLGIVDDPLKNRDEAESVRKRRKSVTWYDSTFYTRQRTTAENAAAIIVCMTRWHLHDLSGVLLAREDMAPERWHVVRFTALAEVRDVQVRRKLPRAIPLPPRFQAPGRWRDRRPKERDGFQPLRRPDALPETVTEEPEWRTRVDESVCEARKPAESLKAIRDTLGGPLGYEWGALYQQRPTTPEGGLFKTSKVKLIPEHAVPWDELDVCRGWDLAATDNGGDWTVGFKLGRHRRTGATYWLHVVRGKWGPAKRNSVIAKTAERDGFGCHQRGPLDPAAGGVELAVNFRDSVGEFPSSVMRVTANKFALAGGHAADMEAGQVYAIDGADWLPDVLLVFGNFSEAADEDDDVDAASYAHIWLAQRARARRIAAGEGPGSGVRAPGSAILPG